MDALRFYGQFEVPVDRFIFERYFPDLDIKGIFVESGAFDGLTESSCKFFEESAGWRGYNLEPVPWIFERLQKNRPNGTNLNIGLSDRSGDVKFQSVIHPHFKEFVGWGSIEHAPAVLCDMESAGATLQEIQVKVSTWEQFIREQDIQIVDLMVLDVEGHELSVLSSMKGSPVLPHVMCIEFGHIGFDHLRQMMEALGYEYDIHSYANAFFVRRDKVPLFALRRAAMRSRTEVEPKGTIAERDAEIAQLHSAQDALIERIESCEGQMAKEVANNSFLKQREEELVALVTSMQRSKGWRLTEMIRGICSRLFR
jgi:FkbM family methyltransferase